MVYEGNFTMFEHQRDLPQLEDLVIADPELAINGDWDYFGYCLGMHVILVQTPLFGEVQAAHLAEPSIIHYSDGEGRLCNIDMPIGAWYDSTKIDHG